jgi:small-conductance mechanosensitive channel
MLAQAAARSDGILAEPPPFALKKVLGDFAVTHEINGCPGHMGPRSHCQSKRIFAILGSPGNFSRARYQGR